MPKEVNDYVPRLVVSPQFQLSEALVRLPLPLPGEIVTPGVSLVAMRAHLVGWVGSKEHEVQGTQEREV